MCDGAAGGPLAPVASSGECCWASAANCRPRDIAAVMVVPSAGSSAALTHHGSAAARNNLSD
ncbi:MAG: hypothetical protein DCC67_19600 [Planctomycetota bacterium]|nr:MAG: hypothetical protein DCC67_19600 [Planctomycetota bacterium]